MATKIDIEALLKTVTDAEAVAAQIVADKVHGASHFAAGIRGSLAAARDLITEHNKLLAEKVKAAATPPAAAK